MLWRESKLLRVMMSVPQRCWEVQKCCSVGSDAMRDRRTCEVASGENNGAAREIFAKFRNAARRVSNWAHERVAPEHAESAAGAGCQFNACMPRDAMVASSAINGLPRDAAWCGAEES